MTRTLMLLHGTHRHAYEQIIACGQLRAQHPRVFSEQVERHFDLPDGSVWMHPFNEFARGRVSDPHLYFTQDPRAAASYAGEGSECLQDALTAAFRLLHPEHHGSWPRAGFAPADTFRRAFHVACSIVPCVLELEVPYSALGRQIDLGRCATVEEWVQAATDDGTVPLTTLMLTGPLPASWIRAVRAPDTVPVNR